MRYQGFSGQQLHFVVDCGLDFPHDEEPTFRGSQQQDQMLDLLTSFLAGQELREAHTARDEIVDDDFTVKMVVGEGELVLPAHGEELWKNFDGWRERHQELFRSARLDGLQRGPIAKPLYSAQEALDYFKDMTDSLGHGIDAEVLPALAALRRWGIHTTASCQGHSDHGLPYPWIDIEPGCQERLEALLEELPGWTMTLAQQRRLCPVEGTDPHQARRQLQEWAELRLA